MTEEEKNQQPTGEPAAQGDPAQAEAPGQQPARSQEGEAEAAGSQEDDGLSEGERARLANMKKVDEYYEDSFKAKQLPDSAISQRNVAFYAVLGNYSYKRYNLHFLTDEIIIFVTGNKYQTYNMATQEFATFHGRDLDGVGSIAVHPQRKHFAVAEKGVKPNIYIYEYPSMKLYRILKGGTDMLYAHCEFSTSGDKLCSLGGAPDYTLTVWDWMAERVILKAKALTTEVFRASFSPFTDDILFTSGATHIKFWKMAQTFTGLKLQGEGAKFGQLELSDISGYHELPDGKVLSGTEYGTLILWEGNLVKAHLVLDVPTKKPLHDGTIEVVLFEDEKFITAGTDGKIKWWSLQEIDAAEGDEVAEVKITPQKEEAIENAHIINMVKGNGFWMIQDGNGSLWKMDCKTFKQEQVLKFHSGSINDMAIGDTANLCVSVGQDGNIKFWDYVRKQPIAEKRFDGEALSVDLMRRSDANKGRVAAVGYNTGIVRIISINDRKIELSVVFKAHDSPIKTVRYSPSQTMLVTSSVDGKIFFFEVNGLNDLALYDPICLINLPEGSQVTDLKWDNNSQKVIVSCTSGYVYEIQKPVKGQINNKETYLVEDYPMRVWKMKMMEFQKKKNQKKDEEEEERKRRLRLRGELPKEEEEEDEDWDPDTVTAIAYKNDDSGQFFVGSQGQYAGYFYLCDFDQATPLQAFPMPAGTKVSFIQFNNYGDLFIMGFENGEIRISKAEKPERFVSVKQHDGHFGKIASAKLSYDERFLVSAGHDGLIFVHTIDKFMIEHEAKFNPLEGVEGIDYMPEAQVEEVYQEKTKEFHEENPPNLPEIEQHIDGVDKTVLQQELQIPKDAPDITDPSLYSIQQAKLRTEEDHRLKLAEEKKAGVREKIIELRKDFAELRVKNKAVEEVIQVSDQDFNIDPEFFEMLLDRNAGKIEETKKEVQWDIEYETMKLNRIKNKFYDVLDFEKFTVKAMRTGSYVTTFRVPKMSDFLQKNIQEFKAILEREIATKEQIELEEDGLYNQMDENQDGEGKVKDKAKAATTTNQQASNVHKTDAERKREERKIARDERKRKIEKYKTKEHLNQGEDQAEKAKIEEARRTYGEYKLKMDPNYEVPEHEQVNLIKKRQQMILLEGSIHKLKVDFNTKINELKIRKKDIILTVEQLHKRLGEINEELGTPEELILPEIDEQVEYPQKFFDINDNDLTEYEELKKKRAEEEKMKDRPKGGKGKKDKEKDAKAKADAEAEAAKEKKVIVEQKEEVHVYQRQMAERKDKKVQETEIDMEMKQIQMIELQHEKENLGSEVNKMINDFDDEIKEMQKEKYRLESDLKNADMKLILLFEELILLGSMESKDKELTTKLGSSTSEKGFIIRDIQEITKKLSQKRGEIESIKSEEQDLMRQFHELCPENHEKYDEILKFYEKITKKRKHNKEKVKAEDGEEDDEDGEAEEDEPEEEEDEDDEDNLNPQFGEETKIEEIEKLRDLRLELFDKKEKIQIYISDLQNQQRRLESTQKRIDQDLLETEEEIADFQKEKMAKLNQLDVSVVLKVKQIQNLLPDPDAVSEWMKKKWLALQQREQEIMEGSVDIGDEDKHARCEEERHAALQEEDWRGHFMPKNIGDSVLFTRTQLLQLIHRKLELDEEIEYLKNDQDDAEQKARIKKKENMQAKKDLQDSEREYNERQMLRFGNLVDLDSLEVSGPSPQVLELQNKFHKQEQRCNKKKEEAEADLEKTQRELTACIQRNTNLLNLIRSLGEEQLDLNRKLDSTNKSIFVDEDNEEKRKIQQKKEVFKQQLESQAKEIDILKTEINLYKRKGGHIYTKVTTNRRVAHLGDN